MMRDPAKLMEHQLGYWGETLKHYVETQQKMMQGAQAPASDGPKDRRFANPMWDTHPWFAYIKQQYLTNAEAVRRAEGDARRGAQAKSKFG